MGAVVKDSLTNAWIPNVSDVDTGDTLTCSIVSVPAHGTVFVLANCSIGGYTPAPGFKGSDSFAYRVTDSAEAFDEATVTVTVVELLPTPTPTPPGAGVFNPATSATLSTLTPGAAVDIDTEFCLGTGPAHPTCPSPTTGDVNFSDVINFIPNEFGVVLDADVPDGAILARLNAQPTFGLLGSHCGNLLPVGFTMFEATTDTSNIIAAGPIGHYSITNAPPRPSASA